MLRSANGNRFDNFCLPPNYGRGCLKNFKKKRAKAGLVKKFVNKKKNNRFFVSAEYACGWTSIEIPRIVITLEP